MEEGDTACPAKATSPLAGECDVDFALVLRDVSAWRSSKAKRLLRYITSPPWLFGGAQLADAQQAMQQVKATLLQQGFTASVLPDGDHAHAVLGLRATRARLQREHYRESLEEWISAHHGVGEFTPPRFDVSELPPARRIALLNAAFVTLEPELRRRALRSDLLQLLRCVPVHDRHFGASLLTHLTRQWLPKAQLLQRMRNVCGEKVAFYFAFRASFERWLRLPAALGVGLTALRLVAPRAAARLTPLLGLVLPLWATAMLEAWRLQQSELAVLWGVSQIRQKERISPSFRGEQVVSLYSGEPALYYPRWKRALKRCVTIPIIAAQLLLLTGIIVGLYTAWTHIHASAHTLAVKTMLVVILSTLWGVLIEALNWSVFLRVARALNAFENWRTIAQRETQLALKLFAFLFVDGFLWYFLLAFFHIPFGGKFAGKVAELFAMQSDDFSVHFWMHALVTSVQTMLSLTVPLASACSVLPTALRLMRAPPAPPSTSAPSCDTAQPSPTAFAPSRPSPPSPPSPSLPSSSAAAATSSSAPASASRSSALLSETKPATAVQIGSPPSSSFAATTKLRLSSPRTLESHYTLHTDAHSQDTTHSPSLTLEPAAPEAYVSTPAPAPDQSCARNQLHSRRHSAHALALSPPLHALSDSDEQLKPSPLASKASRFRRRRGLCCALLCAPARAIQRQRRSFMRRLRASLRHIVYAETVLEESRRPPYDATLDFARLSLELGYVLFFTPVWPLAPLACLVAAAVELRAAAFRLTVCTQRPVSAPSSSCTLGTDDPWISILHAIASVSVVVNVAMITLATQQLDVFFASPDADVRSADIQTDLHLPIYQSASPPQPLPSDAAAHAAGTPLSDGGGAQSAGADYVLTPFDRLLLALVAEHALIAMKLLLHVAYPELPELLLADAKQAERELHKKYLLGVHGKVDTLSRLSPSDAAITSLCPQSAPTGKATTVTVRGEHLGRAVHRGEISLRLVMPKDGSHKESYKESARRAHSALTLPADFVSDRCLSCLLPASEIAGLATITLLPRGGGIAAVDGKDAGACDVDGQSCAFRYYTPCTLLRLKPNTGPLQGGTLVSCAGRGFVSTGEIVARFSAGGLDHCVPAAFISESEIRFISPNLHESGGATVTIALNGTDFEPEGLTFYYQSRACAVQ